MKYKVISMPDMKGLRKVSGYSFEDLTAILNEKEIPYGIVSEPKMQRGFFRASIIRLQAPNETLVFKHLVRPTCMNMFVAYYHAYYEMLSPDYLTNLGKIKVSKGMLVEQTIVYD